MPMNAAKLLLLNVLGGSAADPFSPADIAGLALWLDASDASTLFQDSNGTTPATNDNHPVGRWADKSGKGNHATQNTTPAKPTLKLSVKNGKPILRYGGDDRLTGGPTGVTDAATLFVVGAITSTGNMALFDSSDSASSTNRSLLLFRGDGQLSWRAAIDLANSSTASYAFTDTGFHIHAATHQMSERRLYRNGTQQDFVIASRTINVPAYYSVGALVSSVYQLIGDISEVLLYNAVLTSEQMASVHTYLNSKWAVY